MACAIEDAGFEIRDSLEWLYGTGFPKSLNVGKAIDKSLGAERPIVGQQNNPLPGGRTLAQDEWSKAHNRSEATAQTCVYLKAGQPCQGHDSTRAQGKTYHAPLTAAGSELAAKWEGFGTALKPGHEPIVMARKPLIGTVAANVLEHGTGALNINACRIGWESQRPPDRAEGKPRRTDNDKYGKANPTINPQSDGGRWPANVVLSHADECVELGTVATEAVDLRSPTGSRPNDRGEWGMGAGVDAGSVVPAGEVTIYACAPWCAVRELDRQSGKSKGRKGKSGGKRPGGFVATGAERGDPTPCAPGYDDAGGASRYFYTAKPNRKERDAGLEHLTPSTGGEATGGRKEGSAGLDNPRAGAGRKGGSRNTHPTVKPIALMRWLARLVTPPGGIVLDPFVGSGSTGVAAVREGFRFIGVDASAEYLELAKGRIQHGMGNETT
jgi:site-specific DNA-methyltransferase (adenine-specific)